MTGRGTGIICMPVWVPSVERRRLGENGFEVRLGYELADDYLRFVAARCRPNTVLATAFDLKVFFTAVAKDPVAVTVTDVLEFISEQRRPRRGGNVVRLDDGEAGLSARTIRAAAVEPVGLLGYLSARGAGAVQPGAVGAAVTQPEGPWAGRGGPADPHAADAAAGAEPGRRRPRCCRHCGPRGTPRWCTRCCSAGCAAARSSGCGCRCHLADRRLFVAEGKGGHQRMIPVSGRFFTALAAYLDANGRRDGHGAGVRRAEGPEPGTPAVARRGPMRSAGCPARAGLRT